MIDALEEEEEGYFRRQDPNLQICQVVSRMKMRKEQRCACLWNGVCRTCRRSLEIRSRCDVDILDSVRHK